MKYAIWNAKAMWQQLCIEKMQICKNANMKMTINSKVENAMQGVQFIAQHIRDNDKDNEVLRTKNVKERGKDKYKE